MRSRESIFFQYDIYHFLLKIGNHPNTRAISALTFNSADNNCRVFPIIASRRNNSPLLWYNHHIWGRAIRYKTTKLGAIIEKTSKFFGNGFYNTGQMSFLSFETNHIKNYYTVKIYKTVFPQKIPAKEAESFVFRTKF